MSVYTETFQFIGKGKAYLMPYAGGARSFAGLVTNLTLTANIEEKELPDWTQGGGGLYDSLPRITGMDLEISFREMMPRNVALMTAGYESTVATASVVNEAHTCYQGALTVFDHMPDQTGAITITDNCDTWATATAYAAGDFVIPTTPNDHVYKCTVAGTSHASTEPTWPTNGTTVTDGTATWKDMGVIADTADTDFTWTSAGIVPIVGGGIPDGCPVEIDYVKADAHRVELLTASPSEWALTLSGINEAKSDRPVILDLYRMKFSPAGLAMIADDYWSGDATGKVLRDSTKSASATVSAFGRWIYQSA